MKALASCLAISALLLALFSGCGSSDEEPSSSSEGSASASPTGGIDDTFSVGTYKLHLRCTEPADDKPTIVYFHGLGGQGGDVNEKLGDPLSERGRVCTYDRLNVAGSDDVEARHTGAESVQDLHALMEAAKVPPPYQLVGFSFGGLLATMYAGTYPDEVEGLLLIDSSLPTDDEVDALLPKDIRAQVVQEQQDNGELVDFYATLDEAKALMKSVPDVPVTYLAARPVELPPEWPVKRMQLKIGALQQQFVDRFPQGRLVPVQSSHDIDLEQPDLVIAEFDRVVAQP